MESETKITMGIDHARKGGDQSCVCLRHGKELHLIPFPFAEGVIDVVKENTELYSALKALLSSVENKKDQRGIVWNMVSIAYARAVLDKYTK